MCVQFDACSVWELKRPEDEISCPTLKSVTVIVLVVVLNHISIKYLNPLSNYHAL